MGSPSTIDISRSTTAVVMLSALLSAVLVVIAAAVDVYPPVFYGQVSIAAPFAAEALSMKVIFPYLIIVNVATAIYVERVPAIQRTWRTWCTHSLILLVICDVGDPTIVALCLARQFDPTGWGAAVRVLPLIAIYAITAHWLGLRPARGTG